MSIHAMSQVWDTDLPTSKKFLLLAMADHADHDGRNIFPAVETLARKTGYTTRHVRRLITEMSKAKIIVKEGVHRSGTNIWRIDFSALESPAAPDTESHANDQKTDDIRSGGGLTSDAQGTDTRSGGGLTSDAQRGDSESAEPSLEPSVQPSNNHTPSKRDADKLTDGPEAVNTSVDIKKQHDDDITAIIKIYLDTGVIEKKPGAEYTKKPNRDMAKALLNAGITVDQVQRYVNQLKAQDFWRVRSISLKYILNNIKPWIQAGEPQPETEDNESIPAAHQPWEPPEEEMYINPQAANEISLALTRVLAMRGYDG